MPGFKYELMHNCTSIPLSRVLRGWNGLIISELGNQAKRIGFTDSSK
jgi:hypothetical protein